MREEKRGGAKSPQPPYGYVTQRYSIFANIQAFWRKIQAYRRLRRINGIAYQNAIQYLLLIADKLDKFGNELDAKGGYYEK